MNQIMQFIENISAVQIIDILIAIGIILFFKLFSSSFSYIIIKIFKIKENKKNIKESVFYNPLKILFVILGVYFAIVFLKTPLKITDEVMSIFYKVILIIGTITFAKGLAASFTPKSYLYTKIKEQTNKNIDESMFDFALKIIRGIIFVIAGFIVISIIGIKLDGLIAGLGAGGVILTLAAQDTAKNLFGGIIVLLDKPFSVGDWIQIDEFEGTVEDITFRSTRLRTFEKSLVNIPNSIISNSSIVNWSKMEKRRYRTNLCIDLNTPLDKLEIFKAKVQDMLHNRDAIEDDSIIVKFDNIVDNGLNVLICSYTNSIDYATYISEREDINYKIMKILQEEGIELAYDSKTIYLKN